MTEKKIPSWNGAAVVRLAPLRAKRSRVSLVVWVNLVVMLALLTAIIAVVVTA